MGWAEEPSPAFDAKPFQRPDGVCDLDSFRKYFQREHPGVEFDVEEVFRRLDGDADARLDADELPVVQELLDRIDTFYAQSEAGPSQEEEETPDPGPGYALVGPAGEPIDDAKVDVGVYNRYLELVRSRSIRRVNLATLPTTSKIPLPSVTGQAATIDDLVRATVVIAGSEKGKYYTGGGVLVSQDGLVLTNHHVARNFNSGMVAVTSDGRCHMVVELLAGDPAHDTALMRLEGAGFPSAAIARTPPVTGDDLQAIHHTESRFFTYDRGYLMRNVQFGGRPWMEVSLPYSVGGSGCGVFNRDRELVGLVSLAVRGSGPALAGGSHTGRGPAGPAAEPAGNEPNRNGPDLQADPFKLVVRRAPGLVAIHSLFSGGQPDERAR